MLFYLSMPDFVSIVKYAFAREQNPNSRSPVSTWW